MQIRIIKWKGTWPQVFHLVFHLGYNLWPVTRRLCHWIPWPVHLWLNSYGKQTKMYYIIILFLEKFERYLKCESRNSLLNYEKVKFHFSSMFIISSVGDPRSWFPLIRNFSKVVGPLSLRVSGPYPDRTNWFWTNRLWSVDTWVAYHSRYPKGHCLVKMHR